MDLTIVYLAEMNFMFLFFLFLYFVFMQITLFVTFLLCYDDFDWLKMHVVYFTISLGVSRNYIGKGNIIKLLTAQKRCAYGSFQRHSNV